MDLQYMIQNMIFMTMMNTMNSYNPLYIILLISILLIINLFIKQLSPFFTIYLEDFISKIINRKYRYSINISFTENKYTDYPTSIDSGMFGNSDDTCYIFNAVKNDLMNRNIVYNTCDTTIGSKKILTELQTTNYYTYSSNQQPINKITDLLEKIKNISLIKIPSNGRCEKIYDNMYITCLTKTNEKYKSDKSDKSDNNSEKQNYTIILSSDKSMKIIDIWIKSKYQKILRKYIGV